MKALFKLTTLAFIAVFSLTSCERKENDIAGKGGNATLKVTPQHHARNIDSCTIYIKYNTQEQPSEYDEEVKCVQENGKPTGTFTGLKKGNYYIYGRGWDPGIEQEVSGGIPFTVSEEKTYDITVPVTEVHE